MPKPLMGKTTPPDEMIDRAAQELDFLIKLPAEVFAEFLTSRTLSELANLRNIISMRYLALKDAKDRLVNVLSQLPEGHEDTQQIVDTVENLYGQLIFHEDKTIICNKELQRRGVDLRNPE